MSPKEIAELTDLRVEYVKKTLPKLIEEGDVQKVGYGLYQYLHKRETPGAQEYPRL